MNGRPAKEPIRVYAGLQTADTDEARMDVIIRELERTGAFDRKLLVIIPTTGTGWVDPGSRPGDRDHVQRRHRARRRAVLVSAQLDLVPRRTGRSRSSPAGC